METLCLGSHSFPWDGLSRTGALVKGFLAGANIQSCIQARIQRLGNRLADLEIVHRSESKVEPNMKGHKPLDLGDPIRAGYSQVPGTVEGQVLEVLDKESEEDGFGAFEPSLTYAAT